MTQETTVNSNGQTVYKSRWGYHPCDYETFLKLKELNKLFEKSKQDAKNWYRWARKSAVVRHHDIAEAYRRARTPVSSPDAVPSLGVPVGKIDAMLNDSE